MINGLRVLYEALLLLILKLAPSNKENAAFFDVCAE